jgi:arginine-tRNA-protein transferase
MESLLRFVTPPHPCSYLADREARLDYELVGKATPDEYMARMAAGWRRFGHTIFRPVCSACTACQSLRVPVATFRPNRSQRRCREANEGQVTLRVGRPAVTRAKLRLYDRFHAFQADHKGWPGHPPKNSRDYAESFVEGPFPAEEWCYYRDDRLVGVGYVDALSGGLSAIYFYYDPDERDRSPGTWNVLCVLDEAARRGLSHIYLGYFVAGCRSLEYKANFRPNEVLAPGGAWVPFRD